jgi:cytochrome b561/polyisoprenoid-binding protein YceI
MPLTNTHRSYGAVTKSFHWLTALLIVTVIPLGIVANNLAKAIRDPAIAVTLDDITRATFLFSLHKTIGITIFFVALARIAWAISQPKPGLLNADKRVESLAAQTVHWLLYGSLLLVPLTGWIHHAALDGFAPIWWPFGQNLPFVPKNQGVADTFAGLHLVFERVLVFAILLHVAGALKHHFWDRDMTLRRMWPGRADAPEPPAARETALPLVAALGIWFAALAAGAGLGAYDGHGTGAEDAAALDAVQSDWTVEDGSLSITIVQMGSAVQGTFSDWTAAISFDAPDAPGPAGSVEVTVAIPSLSLGAVTDQAMGPDFFAATDFPTATFAAEIVRTDTGYEATGPLTIKGNAVPVTLPFTLDIDGDTARMSGSTTINRMAFDVGSTTTDEGTLAFAVEIGVNLTARRE